MESLPLELHVSVKILLLFADVSPDALFSVQVPRQTREMATSARRMSAQRTSPHPKGRKKNIERSEIHMLRQQPTAVACADMRVLCFEYMRTQRVT